LRVAGDLVKPEEKARKVIDQLLVDAGWAVQDYKEMNLSCSLVFVTLVH